MTPETLFDTYFRPLKVFPTFSDATSGILATAQQILRSSSTLDLEHAHRLLDILYFMKEITETDIDEIRVTLELFSQKITPDARTLLQNFIKNYPLLNEELLKEGEIAETFKEYLDRFDTDYKNWEVGITTDAQILLYDFFKLGERRSRWMFCMADSPEMANRVCRYLTDLGLQPQSPNVPPLGTMVYIYFRLDGRFLGQWQHTTSNRCLILHPNGNATITLSEQPTSTQWYLLDGKLNLLFSDNQLAIYDFDIQNDALCLSNEGEQLFFQKIS